MSENTLKEWADKNSPFLRLENSEVIDLVYKKFEIVPSSFDPKKESVQYTFEDREGDEKYWTSSSNKIARFFADRVEGEVVRIKREGEGRETKYTVEISSSEEAKDKETKDAVDEILDVDKGAE